MRSSYCLDNIRKMIVLGPFPKQFKSQPPKIKHKLPLWYDTLWCNFIQIYTLILKLLNRNHESVCFWPFCPPIPKRFKSQPPKSIPDFLLYHGTLWYNFIKIYTCKVDMEISTDDADNNNSSAISLYKLVFLQLYKNCIVKR